MLKDKIYDNLLTRFDAAGWNAIQITMNSDGNVITLTPDKASNNERILATAPILSGSMAGIAAQLAVYDQLKKLTDYCETHKKSDDPEDYAWFCDWHEDLFGIRPTDWIVCPEERNQT